MPGNIDKTRPERTGEMSFTGTGVGTIPDLMEEQKDPQQQMLDMLSDIMSALFGGGAFSASLESMIGDIISTYSGNLGGQWNYHFAGGGGGGGGGITMEELLSILEEWKLDIYDEITEAVVRMYNILNTRMRNLFNSLQKQIDNLESGMGAVGPACSLKETGSQVIPNGFAKTKLTGLTAIYDTANMYDAGNSQMIARSTGYYMILAEVDFGGTDASKTHAISVNVNSNNQITSQLASIIMGVGDVLHELRAADIILLNEGDIIALYVWQASDGTCTAIGRLTACKLFT